jgi:2-methylisocitrate lyase-like PEP mutase family enzyme
MTDLDGAPGTPFGCDYGVGIPLAVGVPAGQPSHMSTDDARARFRALHERGTFLMPNAFDRGSCRLLDDLGFPALATTSGGFAASMGQLDGTGSRAELVDHVASLSAMTNLPINVDSEDCYPDLDGGVAETIRLLAAAGASGCSIEDWDPIREVTEGIDRATERVAIASAAAAEVGIVLTARAENHFRGTGDLDDTVARLVAYRAVGAQVTYAPGLTEIAAITRIVEDVGGAVNVLLMPGGPSLDQLAAVGVRRVSVGGTMARVAYGALYTFGRELLDTGVLAAGSDYLSREVAQRAFGRRA